MGRLIEKVIDEMLVTIPVTERKLIQDLKEYRESLWNKAPEVRSGPECFLPVQRLLCKNILLFDEEWKTKLLRIFNG